MTATEIFTQKTVLTWPAAYGSQHKVYFQKNTNIASYKHVGPKNHLYCRFIRYPSRDQMVILQDSARILQKLSILQDQAEKWLSCKICQKNGYLARSARKMVILQDS